ncbi:MAG: ABC transporter substrate-binding protein [Desulfobacterales bacterium]|nr:ABC transporter substrate-binding protein [Desulfobacterales bacterium]MDD4073137.1 ABC transporter substrate-binding protein [Desulfobacterales bacterium]MDD4393599.1 ABC transporter substrate-binding protein [Desulfobacterales bacterium]
MMYQRLRILLPAIFSAVIIACPVDARTVCDMIGRQVHVPKTMERIACPYRVADDMIFALGAADKLIAISTRHPNSIKKSFCEGIDHTGYAQPESSIEEFLRLRPDGVFMRPGPLVSRLEEVGIPVFCLKVEDPDSMIRGLMMMADILGRKDHANRIAAYYREKLIYIKECTASIVQKKTVYMAGYQSVFATIGGDFYQDHLIRAGGGVNVAHELTGGWVSVSREHLVAWNPDFILLAPYSHINARDVMDEAIECVNAVRKEQIHTFPSYLDAWDLPTPESILGIMWLANILYPDNIRFDMEREAEYFYSQFYGRYPKPVEWKTGHPGIDSRKDFP